MIEGEKQKESSFVYGMTSGPSSSSLYLLCTVGRGRFRCREGVGDLAAARLSRLARLVYRGQPAAVTSSAFQQKNEQLPHTLPTPNRQGKIRANQSA